MKCYFNSTFLYYYPIDAGGSWRPNHTAENLHGQRQQEHTISVMSCDDTIIWIDGEFPRSKQPTQHVSWITEETGW